GVLALQVLLFLLEEPEVAGDLVDRTGERAVEAGEMRAAFVRVDVVREGVDSVLVGTVPLHRDLDRPLLTLALEVRDVLVDRVLRRVHVRDEVADPALVVELDSLPAGALVDEDDAQPPGQERGLAETRL